MVAFEGGVGRGGDGADFGGVGGEEACDVGAGEAGGAAEFCDVGVFFEFDGGGLFDGEEDGVEEGVEFGEEGVAGGGELGGGDDGG